MAAVVMATAFLSARASADMELSWGLGFGSFQVGAGGGRFAVTPNVALLLRSDDGWFFVAQDFLMIFGATGGDFGLDNQLAVGGGHSWKSANLSIGASASGYWMTACGPTKCGLVVGVAPGLHARLDVFGPYLSGALGVAINADAGWYGGGSLVLPGGPAVMFTAGPILRLRSKNDRSSM